MRKSVIKLAPNFMVAAAALALIFTSCKKDEPTLGNPPTASDAVFTYVASTQSPNIIEFTASNSSLTAKWDFGNGSTGEGTTVTAIYPYAGTYSVKLTVFNSGGSTSSTQDVVIANDDPSLLQNPIYALLTGGASGTGSKTWAVDSVIAGHFGVGPAPSHPDFDGYYPKWYAASSEEKSGAGMYDDRYTFKLQGFGFDMISNGNVYVNSAHAGIAPFNDTSATTVGDFMAVFPNQLGENWTLLEGADTTITLSGNAMIGYWAGTRTYKIVEIDTNKLVLGFQDAANADLFWYVTLVPEGYVSNPPPPAPTYALPLDFEVIEPEFTVFGNSTAVIVSNPQSGGINTSGKVVETVHGSETWAGFFVNLTNKLDFSTKTAIKLKVWAPTTGTFRMKLEDRANPNSFVEVDVNITVASAWQELTFDFTGTPTSFDRLVMFPGWGVANAGTYYIDDIKQP